MGLKNWLRNWLGQDESISSLERALIGGDNDDYITEHEAMAIPMLSAGIHIISSVVASLPIKMYYSEDDKLTAEPITHDERLKLLCDETGDALNCIEMKERVITDMLLFGSGYIYVNKVGTRYKSLHYVEPSAVSAINNTDPIFKTSDIYVNGKRYYPWDFIILTRNTKDGIRGKGILEENARILKVAYNQLLLENSLSKTGGNKKGFIKAPRKLSDPALDELRERWRKFSTVDGGDSMLILNDGLDFMSAGNTAVEMQLNQSKAANSEQIGMIMLLPKILFSGTVSREQKMVMLETAISPIVAKLEAAINRALLTEAEKQNYYFVVDTNELMKLDMRARFEAYQIGLRSHFLTVDEIRHRENLTPLEFDYINMGLSDVFYNPKTKEFYTPNTNAVTKLEGGGEKRYNPNHDEKTGRFTSKNGGSGLTTEAESSTIYVNNNSTDSNSQKSSCNNDVPSPAGTNILKNPHFRNRQKLNNHFQNGEKHIKEYIPDGITTPEQYEKRAVELLQSATSNTILGHLDKDNHIIRYDTIKNDFVKGSIEKGVFTMFKPEKGKQYYEEQLEEDLKHGGKA